MSTNTNKKTIFYKKVGHRYQPVSEYDHELLDSFSQGSHLVVTYPGGSSRRYNIDPNYAAMIAAGRVAEDAVSEVIRKAGELRPSTTITTEQRAAYDKFMATLPDNQRYYLTYGSAREAAESGVKAMMSEAEKLMKHDAVKLAFDHFIMVCEICKEQEKHGT